MNALWRTDRRHRTPLLAQNLGDLSSAQRVVLGSDLWAPLTSKEHESIHWPFGLAVSVQSLLKEQPLRLGQVFAACIVIVICGKREGGK